MKKKSLRSKLSVLLVAVFISVCASAPAMAGTTATDGDAIKIKLDGQYLINDTTPTIENSTTLVPVRIISEKLGAVVNWNNENRTVAIKTGDAQQIVMSIGSKDASVSNGTGSIAEQLGAAPFIKDGKTMVPLRFIAEKLNLKVDWDNSNRTISLTNNKNKTLPNSVKVSSNNIESKSEAAQVKLNIPQIEGMKDKQLQENINSNFEKAALKFKEETLAGVDEYVKDCKKEGWPVRPYQAVTSYKVAYIGNDVISLYVDYYSYTAGAHGSTIRVASNIDLKTGKELQLKDVAKAGTDYKEIINKEIKKQMQLEPDKYFMETLTGWKGIPENQPYYIEDGNLIIYFGQYEIAPYSSGIPELKIPLQMVPSALWK